MIIKFGETYILHFFSHQVEEPKRKPVEETEEKEEEEEVRRSECGRRRRFDPGEDKAPKIDCLESRLSRHLLTDHDKL